MNPWEKRKEPKFGPNLQRKKFIFSNIDINIENTAT
jgi:hypothetical protein